MSRLNLLLITTDQQRADCLSCYGNLVLKTPHIDRLAREGFRFDRAYVNNPLCMPSRATILTGRNPRSHGVWCNGVPLRSDERLVSQVLAENGYRTALIGKAHFTPYGAPIDDDVVSEHIASWEDGMGKGWRGPYYGFQYVDLVLAHNRPSGHYRHWLEEYHPNAIGKFDIRAALETPSGTPQCWKSAVPVEAHSSTYVADRTIEFIRSHKDSGADQPFFLWCSFPDPHSPFCPPRPHCDLYSPASVPMPTRMESKTDGVPDELQDKPPHFIEAYLGKGSGRHLKLPEMTDDQFREIVALTYGMIALIDDSVGRIWSAMNDLELWETTLVLFCSDHADLLGDHWLMNKGPFHYDSLLRVPFLVRPPLLLAGRTQRPNPDSSASLVQLMDITPTLLEAADVEIPSRVQGKSVLTLISGESTKLRDAILIENSSGELPHLMLKTIRTENWKLTFYGGQAYGELYDLEADPNEFVNLWESTSHQAVKAELVSELMSLMITSEGRLPERLCHA